MVLKIKEYRERKGISVSQLSYKSGVAKSYISELENEKYSNPSLSVICRLCRALLVTPNELINSEFWYFRK